MCCCCLHTAVGVHYCCWNIAAVVVVLGHCHWDSTAVLGHY
jgi:hypothetical protein